MDLGILQATESSEVSLNMEFSEVLDIVFCFWKKIIFSNWKNVVRGEPIKLFWNFFFLLNKLFDY